MNSVGSLELLTVIGERRTSFMASTLSESNKDKLFRFITGLGTYTSHVNNNSLNRTVLNVTNLDRDIIISKGGTDCRYAASIKIKKVIKRLSVDNFCSALSEVRYENDFFCGAAKLITPAGNFIIMSGVGLFKEDGEPVFVMRKDNSYVRTIAVNSELFFGKDDGNQFIRLIKKHLVPFMVNGEFEARCKGVGIFDGVRVVMGTIRENDYNSIRVKSLDSNKITGEVLNKLDALNY